MSYDPTMMCDACLAGKSHEEMASIHVGSEHRPNDRVFTFVLFYGTTPGDEIDILAPNYDRALTLAKAVASMEYESGWTEIRSTRGGGDLGMAFGTVVR